MYIYIMAKLDYCIVYLASPQNSKLSTGQYRFHMLCESIKNTSKFFGSQQYIIFHEDLDEEHKERLCIIQNNILFEKLDFVRDDLDFVQFGRPKGYMLMCRFFSGELQNYLIDHNYDAYIRFDDDSFLLEPYIKKQLLEEELKTYDYIYRTVFMDGQPKFNNGKPMQSLFEFTKTYLNDNGYSISGLIPYLKTIGFLNKDLLYTGLSPYNNFHASTLQLWKEPLIKNYTDTLLKENGCCMNYWMDANIHAMIIFVLLPLTKKRLQLKSDFGYRHNRHFSQLNSAYLSYKSNEPFFPISHE